MDQTLIENYRPHRPRAVKRNDEAYRQTKVRTVLELERLVEMYREFMIKDQEARLVFDSISHWIRRYHEYCIQERIGSHYMQIGVPIKDCIFEHVIPVAEIKLMLIDGLITIDQALNAPTCLLSKDNNQILTESGLVKSTPCRWHFFDRYQKLDAEFQTYNGTRIQDLHAWTLPQHYEFFGDSFG